MASSPEWLVVYSTDNVADAHIVAGRLETEGIPSWVHQQPGASGFGITIGLFGEVRVLVNPTDYDRALAILDDNEPLSLEPDDAPVRYVFSDDESEDAPSDENSED